MNIHFVKDVLLSGFYSSITSTLALALFSKRETGSAFSATNSISHWLWKDKAYLKRRLDVKHTALGYLIHHLSSTFWAFFYEKLLARHKKTETKVIQDALVIATTALLVDYLCTPKRLQPGYEKQLSKKSMSGVYLAFAVGLAAHHFKK